MENRRAQRYNLELPLQILEVGGTRVSRVERTRDISSGGVSFTSPDEVEVGGRIEYVITLSNSTPPVRIRCLGKVLRSRQSSAETGFEVAVSMDRYQFLRSEELRPVAVGSIPHV
ncbi:MAG: PilZ domain-containing protein [Terriglobia bacterium]